MGSFPYSKSMLQVKILNVLFVICHWLIKSFLWEFYAHIVILSSNLFYPLPNPVVFPLCRVKTFWTRPTHLTYSLCLLCSAHSRAVRLVRLYLYKFYLKEILYSLKKIYFKRLIILILSRNYKARTFSNKVLRLLW